MSFNFSALPTSGSFGFRVTGLSEAVNGLDGILREWPVVRTATLNEAARFLTNEMKRNVHVVSGRLKASIGIEAQTSNSVIVSAKMPYARIENARRGEKRPTARTVGPYGPHDYATRGIQATQRDFTSKIKVNFDRLLARHKTI